MTFSDLNPTQKSHVIKLILTQYATVLKRQQFFMTSQAHEIYGFQESNRRRLYYSTQIQPLNKLLKTICPRNPQYCSMTEKYDVTDDD
jgi:hypothetical protein